MATTLNIQRFIRSVRQGRTPEPVSCTAMAACTRQAFDALVAASWTRVEEREAGLPRHNWAQTGFSPRWDAAKYCGDYADGYQHGYASVVCYTIRMPADALAGTAAKIASVSIPVRGDRWLADGCDIGIKLSASATPPAWDAAPDDAVAGQLAVVPSNTGSDTSATVAFDWSSAPKTSLAYLHITLRLTDYLTHRGAWIEGGAMIDGANIAVTFNRDVAPDAATDFDDPAAPPVVVDIPFGFPDMPLKTGAPVGLREISYRYVKVSELAAMGGGATLQLLQTSFLSSQTGFAVPAAGSLTVAGKASGDVTFSGIAGDDILSGTPYFEENIGAGYVGFIRVPLKRVEPVDAGSVTKQAVFTTSNGGVSTACTARLSVPKKQRFYAYRFWDSTQEWFGDTYFANSNSMLYGFSSIVVKATMGYGLTLGLMTPNFGTNGSLTMSVGSSFAYNESVYGTDWTPYLDYNGYSLCVIKGTPASSASIYCGKYVTLTIGSHSCTFGIRWSSSTSYSTYSSHQY
jgi:hypothetical protein